MNKLKEKKIKNTNDTAKVECHFRHLFCYYYYYTLI